MAYDGINRIRIYVDTNKLEVRHDSKYFILNTLKLSNDFYSLLDFCQDFTNVKVCIPTVVWKEVCIHLTKCFSSTFDEMNTKLTLYKKTFGDLFELKFESKGYDKSNYKEFVEQISNEFWAANNDRCNLVDIDMTSEKIQAFIEKAVASVKPFTQAKGGKDYSDAGFKDAIIIETILSTCQEDEVAILFTNDNDFNEVFKQYDAEKFIAVKTLDEVKTEVNKILKLNDDKVVKALFEDNRYNQETLLSAVGIVYDGSITDFTVKSVEKSDEDDSIYYLKINVIANEVKYKISVTYDIAANESVDITYSQSND